jgi:hypothetical protein
MTIPAGGMNLNVEGWGVDKLSISIGNFLYRFDGVLWCRICGRFVGDLDGHLRLEHSVLYEEIKKAKDKRIRDGLIFFTANKPEEGD